MPANKKTPTVNEVIRAGLKAKLPNAAVLAKVLKAHPHSKVGLPTVNYYRNQLRMAGEKIPTELEARKR